MLLIFPVPYQRPSALDGSLLAPWAQFVNAALRDIDRRTRGQRHDSRYLPSTDRRLQQLVRAVSQERDVVDEVNERDVRPIQVRTGRYRSASCKGCRNLFKSPTPLLPVAGSIARDSV